jgi:hypothetical protein
MQKNSLGPNPGSGIGIVAPSMRAGCSVGTALLMKQSEGYNLFQGRVSLAATSCIRRRGIGRRATSTGSPVGEGLRMRQLLSEEVGPRRRRRAMREAGMTSMIGCVARENHSKFYSRVL